MLLLPLVCFFSYDLRNISFFNARLNAYKDRQFAVDFDLVL